VILFCILFDLHYLCGMKRLLPILILLLSPLYAIAQLSEPHIIHFGEHDGYEQSRVNFAIQDKQGYIWLSTRNGLCRYDGYRFVYYTDCPGAENTITKANTIFIRQLDNGDIEGITKDSLFYVFHPRQKRYEPSKGDFLKTFRLYDADSATMQRMERIPQFKGKECEILLVDRQGGIWVNTNSGLYRVYFERAPLQPQKMGKEEGEVVMGLLNDQQGRLWVGDRNGYVRVCEKGKSVKYLSLDGSLSSTPVRFGYNAYWFLEDSRGDMWISTKPGGLFRLSVSDGSGSSYRVRHYSHDDNNSYSLSSDDVYAIAEDANHRLWIATLKGGLNMFDLNDSHEYFIHYRNKLKQFPSDGQSLRSFRVLITPKQLLMVGTDNGLYVAKLTQKPEELLFQHYGLTAGSDSSLGSNWINDIEPIDDNTTAIATTGGGVSIVKNDELPTGQAVFQRITTNNGLASNQCLALRQSAGVLYAVSYSSISRLSNHQWSAFTYPLLASDYNLKETKPAVDSDGYLYFGTTQGVLKIKDDDLQKSKFCPNIVFDSPDTVQLSADDHSLDVTFAALDYNTTTDIVYAYRFEDQHDWIYTTENHIYLHDIKAGTHRLHLRSTNSDGTWVDNERVLTIHRTPHFNETPWAWMLYGLLLTLFIIGVGQTVIYIHRLKRELKDIRLTSGQRIDMMTNRIRELLSIRETVKPAQTAAPADNMENEDDQRFAKEVRQLVMNNLSNTSYSVQDLAHDLLVSRNVLYARMNAIFGTSPYNYLLNIRIEESKKMLHGKDPYITEIAYRCGFSDPKYFSRCFKNVVGMTPSEYILKNKL
jgi:AraC-like DNA-binding protein/streptogramin lyase